MVWGTGAVLVNGKVVPGSLTVYAGDKIATDTDSTATLTNRYGTVTLPGDSAILYGGNNFRMQYGRALVVAQRGTQATLGNLTITPASPHARFQMRQSGTDMVLAVLEGSVLVSDGVNKTVLKQGQMISRNISQPTVVASSQSGNALASAMNSVNTANGAAVAPPPVAPPPDTAAPPPPDTPHAHIPGWVIGTVAAGAAGGIVGGMAAAGAFRPASPVVP
jgi:hypothetical protein